MCSVPILSTQDAASLCGPALPTMSRALPAPLFAIPSPLSPLPALAAPLRAFPPSSRELGPPRAAPNASCAQSRLPPKGASPRAQSTSPLLLPAPLPVSPPRRRRECGCGPLGAAPSLVSPAEGREGTSRSDGSEGDQPPLSGLRCRKGTGGRSSILRGTCSLVERSQRAQGRQKDTRVRIQHSAKRLEGICLRSSGGLDRLPLMRAQSSAAHAPAAKAADSASAPPERVDARTLLALLGTRLNPCSLGPPGAGAAVMVSVSAVVVEEEEESRLGEGEAEE